MKMEVLLKLGAVALLICGVCLVLKKNSPEIGLALSLCVCVCGFVLVAELLRPVLKLLEEVRRLGGLSDALFYPLIKCVGIGIWAKMAADICKDSGQGAMAGMIELSAAICAVYCALPLMNTLVDMLEELI